MTIAELKVIEAKWLQTRKDSDFVPYWTELLVVAGKVLTQLLNKSRLHKTASQKEEIIHDSVTRLVEMYLKRKEYVLGDNIINRVYNEVLFNLHNYKQVRIDREDNFEDYMEVESNDRSDMDLDAPFEGSESLKNTVISIARETCYRKRYITTLGKIMGEEWVRKNIIELIHIHNIYKTEEKISL